MTKTKKELAEIQKQYILGAICLEGYDKYSDAKTDLEKLQAVWDIFNSEYGHQLPHYGNNEQRTFANWLMGLPSCLNIDYENYRIIEIGREWQILKPHSLPFHENRFISGWFNRIYMLYKRVFYQAQRNSVIKKTYYKRKTVDEFQIQGKYSHGWECVVFESTRKEARERLKEYRENEPATSFRLTVKRVPKTLVTVRYWPHKRNSNAH